MGSWGTSPAATAYRAATRSRETAMKTAERNAERTAIAKFVLAGTVVMSLGTAALAQQALTGIVTQVDRINGTVAIRQTQSGTVGTSPSAAEEYKAPGVPLDSFHAG